MPKFGLFTQAAAAPDCLQPMRLRRSGFRQQVSASVGRQNDDSPVRLVCRSRASAND